MVMDFGVSRDCELVGMERSQIGSVCVCVWRGVCVLLHPAFLCLESSSLHFACLVLSPHANLGLNVTFLEEPPLLLALSCSFRGVQTTA